MPEPLGDPLGPQEDAEVEGQWREPVGVPAPTQPLSPPSLQ